jgi:uncharacterized membrane protein YfcA
MTAAQALLLTAAAATGGALNSVAGGGTFIAFPALLLAGVAPVTANATATLALWPGAAASAFAYRRDVTAPASVRWLLGITSLVGGCLGALLLLKTSDAAFEKIIPPLLLFSSLVFTLSRGNNSQIKRWSSPSAEKSIMLLLGAGIQFVIAVYGGYFGAGIGILMIAAWSALGMSNIHGVNGLRSLLGTVINGVAMLLFIVNHSVEWAPGLLMAVTAVLTGYFGAAYARRLPPILIRRFVLAIAWSMTVYFFWKFYA